MAFITSATILMAIITSATIILMALITSATIILMNDPHYFSYLKYSETCLNRILNKPKSFINET
jgi:hypothetical protein